MSAKLQEAADRLFAHAMSHAGAVEDHPWGERVAKVNKKIFAFFGRRPSVSAELTLAVKLPDSNVRALDMGFCEPSAYGMGKHGWVTARFFEGDAVPHELLCAWIDESYRTIAPKSKATRAPSKSKSTAAKPRAARHSGGAAKPKVAPKSKSRPKSAGKTRRLRRGQG